MRANSGLEGCVRAGPEARPLLLSIVCNSKFGLDRISPLHPTFSAAAKRSFWGNMYRLASFRVPSIFVASLISFAPLLSGQSEYHHFTVNVGGGFTTPTGRVGNRIDVGGNFEAGAGFNLNQYLGVLGTFSFQGLGLTGRALREVNVPNGNAKVYTFTVDPKQQFSWSEPLRKQRGGGNVTAMAHLFPELS